jgi:hypothetical protein
MPNLNEYLGGLFNSIASARVISDLQTAQLAEQYAQHEILRHFSVPRMRIGDVELTIPIAIQGMSERSEPQLSPVGNEEFKSGVYRTIVGSVSLAELPLLASQALNTTLTDLTKTLANNLKNGAFEESIKDFAVNATERFIEIGQKYNLFVAIKFSRDRVVANVYEYGVRTVKEVVEKPVLDQLSVIGESHLLREQRPEDIVRIKLIVGESGMEWQTIENEDGSVSRKLLPE